MTTEPKMFFMDDLFAVQKQALIEAGDKPGFAFFAEPGLGKTRMVLYEFHFKVVRGLANVLFVVMPRPLRGGWRDEITELGFPYPVIMVENYKQAAKALNDHRGHPVIIICHYEQVLTHGRAILQALLERKRRVYIALDESVRIKSHTSVIGDCLYLLCNSKARIKKGRTSEIIDIDQMPAQYKRVLSGTPAPQGPHDLWMQFRFLGMMNRWPYHGFRNMFCKMGGYMGKSVMGSQNLDVLRQRTGDFAFRAKKTDWTDLPEKLNALLREIELTPRQREMYLELMHEFVTEIRPDEFITVDMAITVKTKLQQIASGWIYDNEHNVVEIVPIDENPKFNEAVEVIDGVPGKILVFYFFRPTRHYLAQLAEKHGWGHVFLESGLKDAELDARKKAFNTDDDIKVAFCQTDAVKEGHTLLGTKDQPCHNTLFLENTYSLYARQQAEDRNHRHGQYHPVTYHDIASSKEDRAIIKALQRKAGMQEAILSEFTAFNPNARVVEVGHDQLN